MIKKYSSAHHNAIHDVLNKLNAAFFFQHEIMFGGGTRIALELNEYRESIDIDFICPNTASYRAVRTQVSNIGLGEITTKPLQFLRDIRSDRYGVRTVVVENEVNIKLEFISFDDYKLSRMQKQLFPVPCLDYNSCFITKLLAHTDRGLNADKKDFIDLMVMRHHWGAVNNLVWDEVKRHYGNKPKEALASTINAFLLCPHKVFDAAKRLGMHNATDLQIIQDGAETWREDLD